MSNNEFPWNLQSGDEVFWNDPDDGVCSRHYKIRSIEYHGMRGDEDCIICISDEDGSDLECFARELS